MKKICRLISFALLSALALGLFPAATAETFSLYIPSRLKGLRLPDMPEIPDMPEVPALSCWMDLLEDTDDCPKIADPDGDFHLQFDRAIEECWVDKVRVPIDENGYGEIPAELTDMQMIDILAVVDGGSYLYRTPGEMTEAFVEFDGGLTVHYNEYGCATWMLLTVDTDYFRSGMEGAVSYIEWDRVIVEDKPEAGSARQAEREQIWYVSYVQVDYPEGSYIRRAIANYLNDKKATLNNYLVIYDVTPEDRYLIKYAGTTYTSGGIRYQKDQILNGLYEDLSDPNVYTVNPWDGLKLPGRLYENASGKYFGGNRWISVTTAKAYQGRKNLRTLKSFVSPRVDRDYSVVD